MPKKPSRPAAVKSHHAAIGKVVAAWSYFEAVVDTWSSHFANISPEISVCFTSQMIGHRPKMNALFSLIRIKDVDAKDSKRLNQILEKTTGLAEQRNRIIQALLPKHEVIISL